jgi:hypothetical protein
METLSHPADERMELLKRAYRTIKKELKERETEFDEERGSLQREKRALARRVNELEQELCELREAVRARGRTAMECLSEFEQKSAAPARPPASPAPAVVVNSSYQRGMEWADKVMNARDTLSVALSTSGFREVVKESVSALAMPQSVQLQLQRQQQLFEAQAQVQQSLWLDVKQAEAALAHSDAALQAEIAARKQQRNAYEQVLAETRADLDAVQQDLQQLRAARAAQVPTPSTASVAPSYPTPSFRYLPVQAESLCPMSMERTSAQQQLEELASMLRALLHDACDALVRTHPRGVCAESSNARLVHAFPMPLPTSTAPGRESLCAARCGVWGVAVLDRAHLGGGRVPAC